MLADHCGDGIGRVFRNVIGQILAGTLRRWFEIVQGPLGPDPDVMEAARKHYLFLRLPIQIAEREGKVHHAVDVVAVTRQIVADGLGPFAQDLVDQWNIGLDI